ncbi:hypothetical protein L1857_22880 [Amycolatopsis thermalba]|uniref:Uncharacterized protein n=1 Tax=Amycolatopsis thermalba TaxID=944492 RepID=A0ABY4NZD3_9PSEU|nr:MULTISPECIES: hypothetical protein [Amycolatopsis]OXM66243.1 hypothetical protein CF166_26820 [Amycolatopsis sp. KNN50.9b]UQS25449.1 hypothetical protein L1857_22880 [Amycolatopsis thermalba]
MTYPPQPGQYPAAPPPYPGEQYSVQQPPSGGTAITAGVLAVLGALWGVFSGILNLGVVDEVVDDLKWIVVLQGTVYLVEFATLLPGAILLFLRKPAGRWLVALGSALHILQGVIALIVLASDDRFNRNLDTAAGIGGGVGGLLVVLSPAIATLVLVLVPLTARWCAWGKRPPQQPGPYQGPPPQQQQW